jgi:hypothetical protein
MGGAKSGGYSASGASSVGYARFDRDIASPSSAIREINGKKKHLDFLLHDRLRANEETYGTAEPPRARERSPPPAAPSFATTPPRSPPGEAPPSFLPAYAVGGEVARDCARNISGHRTPSGHFVSRVNPALQPEHVPSTHPGRPAVYAELDALVAAKKNSARERAAAMEGDEGTPSAATDEATGRGGFAGAGGTAGSSGGKLAPWATTFRTGDRAEAAAIAKRVAGPRTPSGNFTR